MKRKRTREENIARIYELLDEAGLPESSVWQGYPSAEVIDFCVVKKRSREARQRKRRRRLPQGAGPGGRGPERERK